MKKKTVFDAYLHEYALIPNEIPGFVAGALSCGLSSKPTLNKTTEFVRWKEAWVYHFNTEGLKLLDISKLLSVTMVSTFHQHKNPVNR